MKIVALTALGVGGATVLGAILGFALKKITHRISDIVLAFAAGIMMAAAVIGLIIPSLESGGKFALLYTIGGIFCGAFCINLIDKLVPHLHRMAGVDIESHADNKRLSKILLFVLAIAIHNFPEGIAAGVGFGSGNTADGLVVAGGIALQNIPEGMVIIAPMLSAGLKPSKTFLFAALTGVVEVIGTFIGFFAVSFSSAVLPFALAFAGGTMLYVISDEMIPETHHDSATAPTFSLLIGFCVMLITDFCLG
ncbi:MAG: ZIP family metal transporter [Clostridia bacterium]|nr:ZIP family metal transporter [Clostridia bacterium]